MDAYEWQEAVDRWTIPAAAWRSATRMRPAVARAQGPVVHDTDGRRYLDFGASPAAAVLGHNHPRYVEAVKRRLHTIGGDAFLDADALRLHCRLGEILTPPLQKSLLLPHGEAASRVAAGIARGVTGGTDIVSVSALHDGDLCFAVGAPAGVPGQARAATPVPAVASSRGPAPCPDPSQCVCGMTGYDRSCPWAGFDAALRACTRRPAALFMAPFGGGAFGARPGCARLLRRLCHQHGMLLVVDESATGYGRTGRMWGHQHDDIVPDILIARARFGAGLSIDAVCTTPDIADQLSASHLPELDCTWHDPVACAAAATAIDIVLEEDLVPRALGIGEHLKTRLGAIAADKPLIRAIHGRGTMYTVELGAAAHDGADPRTLVRDIVLACRDKGLLLESAARGVPARMLRVAPPMVSTESQVDEGLDILDAVLRDMARAFDPTVAAAVRSESPAELSGLSGCP